MATRDKLIFHSAITRILRHFSVLFPSSDHFFVMCAIESATVKRRDVQFRSRQLDSAAPPSHLAPSQSVPSTSAPSSSTSDVSLRDIMVQLQRMDSRLDTLSTELYQVNIHVSCIARRQAAMCGFAPKASPPPLSVAYDSKDEDDDDGDDNDTLDDDNDGDASSTDEMSSWHSYPLSLMTKRGSSFGYESSYS